MATAFVIDLHTVTGRFWGKKATVEIFLKWSCTPY